MIRVTIVGADDALRQALAPRLRNHAIVAGEASADCDAAVVLNRADVGDVERFLEAGKHVLAAVELFRTSASLQKSAQAGRNEGRFGVVNVDRCLPSRQLIRQQLEAGKLGTPGLVRSQRWDDDSAEGPGLPGALMRDLDVVLWLMGTLPNRVYAVEQLGQAHERVAMHVHLGFPDGGMALVDFARRPVGGGYASLALIGSKGAACADDHDNMQLVFGGSSPTAIRTDEGIVALAAAVQRFCDAPHFEQAAGTRTLGELSDWHQTLRVAEAAAASAESHQALAIGVERSDAY